VASVCDVCGKGQGFGKQGLPLHTAAPRAAGIQHQVVRATVAAPRGGMRVLPLSIRQQEVTAEVGAPGDFLR